MNDKLKKAWEHYEADPSYTVINTEEIGEDAACEIIMDLMLDNWRAQRKSNDEKDE